MTIELSEDGDRATVSWDMMVSLLSHAAISLTLMGRKVDPVVFEKTSERAE